jgi:hypothetical protein
MIYKFVLISDEVDGFSREIMVDAEATFLDLNEAVLNSVNYSKDQITSFFICNDDWEKETEITLFEMNVDSDVDNWIMNKAVLSELIPDEKQKLIYVFDNLNDRVFFMELVEIIYNKNQPFPQCISTIGDPPPQLIENFDIEDISASSDIGENFYGDEDFDPDELDDDSFENFDDGSDRNFDDRF